MKHGARGTAAAVLAVSGALAGLVTGCQSQQETYCDTLREEQKTFAELNRQVDAGEDGVIAASVEVFERIREEAPQDLVDEWDTFIRAWQGLATSLEQAEVSERVFRRGEQPKGVSDEEYAAISDAAAQLVDSRVLEAASGIEQHARDVCKVELSGSQLQ